MIANAVDLGRVLEAVINNGAVIDYLHLDIAEEDGRQLSNSDAWKLALTPPTDQIGGAIQQLYVRLSEDLRFLITITQLPNS